MGQSPSYLARSGSTDLTSVISCLIKYFPMHFLFLCCESIYGAQQVWLHGCDRDLCFKRVLVWFNAVLKLLWNSWFLHKGSHIFKLCGWLRTLLCGSPALNFPLASFCMSLFVFQAQFEHNFFSEASLIACPSIQAMFSAPPAWAPFCCCLLSGFLY